MTDTELRSDISLFYNDLSEYRISIEGKMADKVIVKYMARRSERNRQAVIEALDNYWSARNGHDQPVFTYNSPEDRQRGIEIDNRYAQAYRDYN